MATIRGSIIFDSARTAVYAVGMAGMENVAVILQDITTNESLAVLTNSNGEFEFINVPDGDYRIVEAYGTPAGPSPGDFGNAAVTEVPPAAVPPISFATNPPPTATHLDCTTPNTQFATVANNEDPPHIYILNGPVRYQPITDIMDESAVILPENLIVLADLGTFGTLPQGTEANTSSEEEPYPGIAPDFEYVMTSPEDHVPDDGQYSIQNLMNNSYNNRFGSWWRIADRTTGNETGRLMLVNGDQPDAIFYMETVAVKPNTHYLFSAWILNMFKVGGYADPALGVQILDSQGRRMYFETLGAQIPANSEHPEWKQFGTVIYSGDNEELTVEFLSEGPAAWGNDYAIDDIQLNEIDVPVFVPVKESSASNVTVGDTITFTVTLENTSDSDLVDLRFYDRLPPNLAFEPGTVRINGEPVIVPSPQFGFSLPDIPSGGQVTVNFDARAIFPPTVNPVINTARITYRYTPIIGGILGDYEQISNEVPIDIETDISPADVELVMSKIGVGAPLSGGEFEFVIFDEDGIEVFTATNDANGLITFPIMQFSAPGLYRYTVRETDGPADWDLDTSEWHIEIDVVLVDGSPHATVIYPDGVPSFVNTHSSATCGMFVFPELIFDTPGTYEYTLREKTPSGGGWVTDPGVIRVIVDVVDDGHGNLVSTVSYPDDFPSFTNTFSLAPSRTVISGCKIGIGAPLPDGRFTFGLYDESGQLISTATNGPAEETINY
ncbi:MAG: DUF11 domain-containing protein [Clostridiales bacterium]|jgi:uncharacterized repeat protein (TIGR01451 family)/pilin isopeptide linkage protein|nr:DUF11 domain-containing protein [Clostridiales bacterium]